jgi:XTP/dITP diphosphohydrolase
VRLLVATTNPHKARELARALAGWQVEPFAVPEQPPEEGAGYLENARAKARHARPSAPADAWVAGEDSGIEAAALAGRPGVVSARWAEDGIARLLAELAGVEDRRARYVSALVAIGPDGTELAAVGTLEGTIAAAPRGREGFGYDPVFVPAGEERTVAELGDAWKQAHSHRARAAAELRAALERRGA